MAEIEATFDFTSDNSIEADFVLYSAAYYDFKDGFSVDGHNVYLAPATDKTIGGVIIGSNLAISETGVVSVPEATETTKGVSRIATLEEVIFGEDNETIVTPYTLKQNLSFVFEQDIAENVWTIVHNLNRVPSVTVVDSAGNAVCGEERIIDENTIELIFNISFKGTAYLS